MKYLSLFVLAMVSIILSAQPKPVKPGLENDPKAEKYLKIMKEKFDKMKAYKLSYKVASTDANGKTSSQSGFYIGSKEKYIIEIDKLKIVNNGKIQWNIDESSKEIQIQSIASKSKKSETPMSVIKNYKLLFKYRVKESITNNVIVLELVPLNKNNAIFKIDLAIQVASQQLVFAKFYDRGGSRIQYNILSTTNNPPLAANTFDIETKSYKGWEILDMR
ncbi:MAG: LolA family protein [Chitinophagales bacterium]